MIYLQTPLKAFLIDEAAHQGVCEGTIRRWLAKKYFFQLAIERMPSLRGRVWLTGTTIVLSQTRKNGPLYRYDWKAVDWRMRNCEIARRLGCHHSRVSQARRQFQT